MSWSSWSETAAQYRVDEAALVSAKQSVANKIKTTPKKQRENIAHREVDRGLLASMIGSTRYALNKIEKKLLYDLGAFSPAELGLLSGQERQIAELKQKHSNREIAGILGISAQHVQSVHRRCINKLKRIHFLNNRDIPLGLTKQQEKIYVLHFKGKKSAVQIARALKISVAMAQKQICAIHNAKQ